MFTIPPLTSDIMAISLDALGSPALSINLNQEQSTGWGFGWYPNDGPSAMLAKDPVARRTQVLVEAITEWANFRSTTFFCKVHGATQGYTQTETQPFSRSFSGCDWMFMHNGHLDKSVLKQHPWDQSRSLEPLGSTDSELAFCHLLSKWQTNEARRIADIDPRILHAWLLELDALGSADIYLTDGNSIACFHGSQSPKPLYYSRIQPPESQQAFESDVIHVMLDDPRDTYRTALIATSSPFTSGTWQTMQPKQLIIIRRGLIVWDSAANHSVQDEAPLGQSATPPQPRPPQPYLPDSSQPTPADGEQTQVGVEQTREHVVNIRAMTQASDGSPLAYRLFNVLHSTHYEYSEPVIHSTHFFRLLAVDDFTQEVVQARLSISAPTEEIQYEDVFGNQVIHSSIDTPYTKLSIEASSLVKIFATPPDDHSLSRRQTSMPLVWMPWQRQMMTPYLLPAELPETQLTELTEYAMSFVERNDYHLLKTIEDINLTLYRDYQYVPGITSLSTTPFEIYTSRRGVCQDFANLFICLARLLSIPARYRMGYIYTGADYSNTIQSDASHAWVEVYLPYLGWRGYDPTNGCQVHQNHIRVACGRNYRDATPTAGTIFKGGGTESLSVDVKITEVHDIQS